MLTNVILLWPSTEATIPYGWTRETTLNDRFIKSYSVSVGVNNTGGIDTHAHTGIQHTHAVSGTHGHWVTYNAVWDRDGNYGGNSEHHDEIAQRNHNHAGSTITDSTDGQAVGTIAYPVSTNNNRPPYWDFIFIKGSDSASISASVIALFNSTTLPAGWQECTTGANGSPALGNRYSRGTATAGAGDYSGSLTHTHDISHSHYPLHTHTGRTGNDDNHPTTETEAGWEGRAHRPHTHAVTLPGAYLTTSTYSATYTSGTVEPEYKKLLAIQNINGGLRTGIIGLWLGDVNSLPNGWLLCDGRVWNDGVTYTPDMRDKFLKFANSTSEIGNTGGSNTHSHSASDNHSHTQTANHQHPNDWTGRESDGTWLGGGMNSNISHEHTVNQVGANNTTVNWGYSTISAESQANQPPYRTVAFIQLQYEDLMSGML